MSHFVVQAVNIKFSPLPRSVLLKLRYIRFSTIFIINRIYVLVFTSHPTSYQVSPVCEALILVQNLQLGIQLCNSLRNAIYTYLLMAAHRNVPAGRGVGGACLAGRRGRLTTGRTNGQLWAPATSCFITHTHTHRKCQVFRVVREEIYTSLGV